MVEVELMVIELLVVRACWSGGGCGGRVEP